MKNLIVYAHPNPKSFCNAIVESIVKKSEEKGNETKVRDLYKLNFNPVLSPADFESFGKGQIPQDIKEEQEYIEWADVITFVYPIWWAEQPAILKGYIDRVFSYGFAYKYENGVPQGLLEGKKVITFNTSGTSNDQYEAAGMHDAMKKMNKQGIFSFCGLEVLDQVFFGSVPHVDDEVRKSYLKEAEEKIEKLL
ncbi:NAD(P)H-dependent oxidoreductase [Clostridium sp. MSJ-4]|uniref:NAD(P)H-dependent oxidoreductase n=1 Tax=Clostridium simiarum TaxID=2841506 RepID=A0ABS6F1Q4_9CLOT|nr:NAD(P)H-dependent oxidoreductase [Clostridium simiarum]MBU5592211.1 NAD(P)H-dependent oxidoreductase [Clostridium simiarum]